MVMKVLKVDFYSRGGAKKFKEYLSKLRLDKFYEVCCMCGWDKASIDLAHLVPHSEGGGYTLDNILPLCPNHHRQLDRWLISDAELENIQFFLWEIDQLINTY